MSLLVVTFLFYKLSPMEAPRTLISYLFRLSNGAAVVQILSQKQIKFQTALNVSDRDYEDGPQVKKRRFCGLSARQADVI